ncbi:hypothetical protein CR513_10282, partial [Mucuna pruriens]
VPHRRKGSITIVTWARRKRGSTRSIGTKSINPIREACHGAIIIHQVYEIIIPIGMWPLWCSCNKLAFEDVHTPSHIVVSKARALKSHTLLAFSGNNVHKVLDFTKVIGWQKPLEDVIVLNVDENALNNPCKIMALFYDIHICWQIVYKKFILRNTSIQD